MGASSATGSLDTEQSVPINITIWLSVDEFEITLILSMKLRMPGDARH